MKKIIFMFIALLMIGCSKEEMKTIEDVTFYLSYEMNITSGSMTRANGDDLYNDFYNTYIKTKQLGYPSYELTFYKDNKEVGTFKGEWDATLITLPEGIYTVKGKSNSDDRHLQSDEKKYSNFSLSFNEQVTITKKQNNLILKPKYSCYLLFIDNSNFSSIKLYGAINSTMNGYIDFTKANNISYVFINDEDYAPSKITYTTTDNDSGTIQINQMGFENGKYYFLDKLITTYEIPPMDSGF